jgi:hypothetical protein
MAARQTIPVNAFFMYRPSLRLLHSPARLSGAAGWLPLAVFPSRLEAWGYFLPAPKA